jgi:LacI family transcriptional regulator
MSAIEELGYIPSRSASYLRKGNSGIIGCYAIDITENFASKIVRGIERGLRGSDLTMLFVSGVEFGNDFSRACHFLESHKIDGLILCHHIPDIFGGVQEIRDSGIPIVSVNMKLEGIPSIFPDHLNGGIIAAEHLYTAGMRHPAMICGPGDRLSNRHRLKGFSERIRELGLVFSDAYFIYGDYGYEHGFKASAELLERDSRIDGIFCANDFIAAGAINRLTLMGCKIPEDVRIVGFDNRDFSGIWHIPISTFEQPLEEMGFLGISALRCAISSGSAGMEQQILQSRLLARTSSIGAGAYNHMRLSLGDDAGGYSDQGVRPDVP